MLEFSTDTLSTVYIEWRFISEIISDKIHSVEIKDGARVLGSLRKPADGEHVLINAANGVVDMQPDDILSFWPVETDFLDKMELDLSFGLDYSNATKITNLNVAVDFKLRSDDRLTEATLRSNVTQQSDADFRTPGVWLPGALVRVHRVRKHKGKYNCNNQLGGKQRVAW